MKSMIWRATILVVTFCFLAPSADSKAQRVVEVEPGLNTLNDAMAQDENPDEAVFVLERGGTYEFDTPIEYEGEILRIHAAEGDGPRPIIRPAVDITGSSPAHHFAARSDLELESLILLGIDDLGAYRTRQIRMQADSTRLVINNVLFESIAQDFIRLDAPGTSVFITNTTGRNNGIDDGQTGGRILDTRGNDVDTLFVQNSTFYQMLRFALRADGGFIRHLVWDHVTTVNVGLVFQLGRAVDARISNSIFYNLYPPPGNLADTLKPFVTIDSLVNTHGFTDDDRNIVFENVNFVTDPDVHAIIPDTIAQYRFLEEEFDAFINAGVADTMNIFAEDLDFAKAPPNMAEYMMYVWTGGATEFPRWRAYENEEAYEDPLVVGELPEDMFNFSYSSEARSFNTGTDGFPIGDLRWFPDAFEEWVATDVEETDLELPEAITLYGNYPNPFNPGTRIAFDLGEPADVRVDVFDVLGRQIATLRAGMMAAGARQIVEVDGSGWSSGTYLYRLTASGQRGVHVKTGVMTLLK